jgi:hypothetical protein
MAEETLKTALSGAEIVEAIADKVRQKLRTDCQLNPNSAYDWFDATITIELNMHDTGVLVKGDYNVKATAGKEPEQEMQQHVPAELYIAPAPPNEVRVDTGQPVPVLTKDEQGRQVVKGVKYSRSAAKARGVVAMLLFCVCLGWGQEKPKAEAPKLKATYQIALDRIREVNRQINDAQKTLDDLQQARLSEVRAIEADITKEYPGYHLNEDTGLLEKDAPAKK